MTETQHSAPPEAFLAHQPVIESALRHFAFPEAVGVPKLHEAMCYSLFAGGKRLRPALVLLTFNAAGGGARDWQGRMNADPDATFPDDVLAVAVAYEMVHTYSLIHDDLPAMDNDDLRRGRPTNHKVFGEATAILAGDAMLTSAFRLIAREVKDASVARRVMERLADAAGGGGMVGGQMDDLAAEGRNDLSLNDLRWIHQRKTGRLMAAAIEAGAIVAGADEAMIARLLLFGEQLGQAFQIADDILDVVSSPEVLGKSVGKDEASGKLTYPALLGIEGARAEAARVAGLANDVLKESGLAGSDLESLVDFVVKRAN